MSTQDAPKPIPESRPSTQPVGPGTLTYRIAVLVLLCVNAWYLHGIKYNQGTVPTTHDLKVFSSLPASKDTLSEKTQVLPVFIVNGLNVSKVEGHGGNATYVAPLNTTIDNPFGVKIDAPFGLPVKIQDQPVRVQLAK